VTIEDPIEFVHQVVLLGQLAADPHGNSLVMFCSFSWIAIHFLSLLSVILRFAEIDPC